MTRDELLQWADIGICQSQRNGCPEQLSRKRVIYWPALRAFFVAIFVVITAENRTIRGIDLLYQMQCLHLREYQH